LIPDELDPQQEPVNGDGREFKSKDGTVRVTAWAMWLSEVNDFDDLYREALKPDGEHRAVTYHARGASWFVTSGRTADGRVFYERSVRHRAGEGEQIGRVELVYPDARRATYDTLAVRIAESFKFGATGIVLGQ